MLALKGDSSSPSTTLRTGMVLSVPASVAVLGRLARCCGVVGKPGGERGDGAAALGEAAEALGGVLGASSGCAAALGEAAEALGASGGGAVLAGGGVGLAAVGPGGASVDWGQFLSSSSTMAMTSSETRCCCSLALATQWVSRVL